MVYPQAELTQIDQNRDGQISRSEWFRRYGDIEDFDRWDTNGDGYLDEEEMARRCCLSNSVLCTDW